MDNDLKPICLVLADISGYTNFVKENAKVWNHANIVINTLLETIVGKLQKELVFNKFEGDAALLITHSNERQAAILDCLFLAMAAFENKLKELISVNSCNCKACNGIHLLRLKFVFHYGEAIVHCIGKSTEVSGLDVIIVHRLLKNHVPSNHYFLITSDVTKSIQLPRTEMWQKYSETYGDVGNIEYNYLVQKDPFNESKVNVVPASRIKILLAKFKKAFVSMLISLKIHRFSRDRSAAVED